MTKTFSLLVLLILLVSSMRNPYEPLPGQAIVAGRIINGDALDDKVIKVNFFDPFDIGTADSKAMMVNSDGEFRIVYEMPFATEITIDYYQFIYAFLGPGDSIYVEIDAKGIRSNDPGGAVKFSGDKSDINGSLWKTQMYVGSLGNQLLYAKPPSDSLTVTEFKREIDRVTERINDSITVFSTANNISPEAAGIARLEAKDLISYYWIQGWRGRDRTPEGFAARNAIYTYEPFDTFNPYHFKGQMFSYHLSAYTNNLLYGDKTLAAFREQGEKTKAWSRAVEILSDVPAGFNRDYMAFQFLQQLMPYPLDSPERVADIVSSPFVLGKIREMSDNRMPAFDRMEIEGITYLTSGNEKEILPRGDFIEYLTEKYPGKVLYIDVWATWCGPCIGEFAASNRLKESLKNEDVVFIYLCLRSPDPKRWLSLIEKHALQQSEHYFFDADATKLFMTNYYMEGFPSYMIIGKDRKIKDNYASRPSSDQVTEEIRSHLTEADRLLPSSL